MALKESREKVSYISISSDAILRKVVPVGTVGAKERTYETKEKNADGSFIMGTKIEKHYESVSGKITNISFVDTDYGTLLQVELTDVDTFTPSEPEILSMSTSQSFAQDFMKKLPNIDFSKEVTLRPFSFTPEGGKRELKGLTVTQDGVKIEKSFTEEQTDPDGKKNYVNTMGYPTPDPKFSTEKNEMKRKEGWKRYFVDCQIFLVDYTTEHFVSKFNKNMVEQSLDNDDVEIPEDY